MLKLLCLVVIFVGFFILIESPLPDNCGSLSFTDGANGDGESSLVSEFSLVCDREWFRPTTMSAFMGGVLVGAVSLGTAADVFGRKFTLFLTLFFMVLTSLWAAYSSR